MKIGEKKTKTIEGVTGRYNVIICYRKSNSSSYII